MKKIAILNFYGGVFERGTENWVAEVCKRIPTDTTVHIYQSGKNQLEYPYNVEVYTEDMKIDWSKSDSSGTFFRRLFLDYWSLLIGLFTLKVSKKLISEKYDIVIPVNGGWNAIFIRFITLFSKSKMLIIGHSGLGWDDRINLYTFPDCFVSLSKAHQNWAKKINPFIPVKYIPNGVDLKKFSNKGEKIRLKKPTVLAVGALNTGKRLDLVIKAVSKLKNVNLLILGDGDLKHDLLKLGLRLLGKDRFKIKKVDYEKIEKYYRSVELFTLPSGESESFGLVFLEALASGVPVVANDDKIRRTIIGEAGLYVDPTNIDNYAKAIKLALNKDWDDKPRKQAEKFSWDKIVDEYKNLFNKM